MAKFYITNLLEFMYDCFKSRAKEYLFDRLTREELKRVKSESKIKSFVEKGRFEDAAIMLSKLNHGVAIVIWDKEKEKRECVKDILIAQLEVDPKDLTRHLVKSKIYASESIDIIRGIQVVSKASNSKSWSINRKYLALSNLKNDHFKQRSLLDKLEAESNLKWYVNTIDHALNLPPLLEHYKIELCHFKILLYLQNADNGATIENVCQKMNTPKGFKNMLNKLETMNMIQYEADRSVIKIGTNGLVTIDAIISNFP